MSTVVGVVGGGQLARMMVPPAIALGIELRVLAEQPGSSAQLAATAVGDYTDAATVREFAAGVDVLTFDHEHVPQDVLAAVLADGIPVRPGPEALACAQDKIVMRERLGALGVPVPEWAAVADAGQLAVFLDAHGGAAVVKTPRGGYDGKGVRVVRAAGDAGDWFAAHGTLLVEELVGFRRELAQLVARRPSGEIRPWSLVETLQRDGVCAEVTAPAPDVTARAPDAGGRGHASPRAASGDLPAEAERIARLVAEGLDVTGVLAVELFETADGRLLVNELAMRPHNSGHWTIEGAVTSQFEQHLRAVLDLPLGDPSPRAPWAVMVNVLGGPVGGELPDRYPDAMAVHPDVKLHAYGKQSRPGRKVGHVTATGDDLDAVLAAARDAAEYFAG